MQSHKRVTIEWEGFFSTIDLPCFEAIMGIYIFLGKHSRQLHLLYIGMTYWQTFYDEIRAKINGDIGEWIEKNHFDIQNLRIKLGHIVLKDRHRISEKLVKDIESLHIIVHKPPWNIMNINTYRGDDLRIENSGKYRPLRKRLSTDQLNNWSKS
ncbi:MAG: hypothetical protein A2Y62_07995 [Candidatus Fischerbacteria bacterium RBG_13_37_8]|uniref:Uncharacterized protein n=1 Tax=Candidatus Fischerbacteria bacterium RBG_13_37_8 TaxID=1817863 RepID=A0A1F5V6R2_9BACT|nr:MAG: hypothetical protein A2Y62_07995 [Candidatus Fischerbacteria bacterium RBG_13_37_8]